MELGDDPHIHGPEYPEQDFTVADLGGITVDCWSCKHPVHLPGECSEQLDGDDCGCQEGPEIPKTYKTDPRQCVFHNKLYPAHDYFYGNNCRRCGHPQTIEEKLQDLVGGVQSGHLDQDEAILRIRWWADQFVKGAKLTEAGAARLIRDRLERADRLEAASPRPLPERSSLERRIIALLTDDCKHLTGAEITDIVTAVGDTTTPLIVEVLLADMVKQGRLVIKYSVPEEK